MGNSSANILLSTETALLRLSECVFPHDKEAIRDYLEILDFNLTKNKLTKTATSHKFLIHRGLEVIVKLIQVVVEDEIALGMCLTILESQSENTKVILKFMQLGALSSILRIEKKYAENETISASLLYLKEKLVEVGSSVAMEEITHQLSILRLCEDCQANHIRDGLGGETSSTAAMMAPVTSMNDRVNRILELMEIYLSHYELQLLSLDALFFFARKRSYHAICKSNEIITTVARTLYEYMSTKAAIIWRACIVLEHIAATHKDFALKIVSLDVHSKVCVEYARLGRRPRIQQVILRLLASIAAYPSHELCRVRLQQSNECMKLFEEVESKMKFVRGPEKALLVSKEAYAEHFSVVMPIALRTLLREAPLMNFVDENGESDATRKKIYEPILKPLFGTVPDTYFKEGIEGLLD